AESAEQHAGGRLRHQAGRQSDLQRVGSAKHGGAIMPALPLMRLARWRAFRRQSVSRTRWRAFRRLSVSSKLIGLGICCLLRASESTRPQTPQAPPQVPDRVSVSNTERSDFPSGGTLHLKN